MFVLSCTIFCFVTKTDDTMKNDSSIFCLRLALMSSPPNAHNATMLPFSMKSEIWPKSQQLEMFCSFLSIVLSVLCLAMTTRSIFTLALFRYFSRLKILHFGLNHSIQLIFLSQMNWYHQHDCIYTVHIENSSSKNMRDDNDGDRKKIIFLYGNEWKMNNWNDERNEKLIYKRNALKRPQWFLIRFFGWGVRRFLFFPWNFFLHTHARLSTKRTNEVKKNNRSMNDDDGWIQHTNIKYCYEKLPIRWISIDSVHFLISSETNLCCCLCFRLVCVPFQIYSLQKRFFFRTHEWVKWVERRGTHSGTNLFIGHHFRFILHTDSMGASNDNATLTSFWHLCNATRFRIADGCVQLMCRCTLLFISISIRLNWIIIVTYQNDHEPSARFCGMLMFNSNDIARVSEFHGMYFCPSMSILVIVYDC